MSAGECSQPSSMNSAIDFSPSPSMSSAPRDTKCRSRSNRWAGQIRPPVQRTSTSPSSPTASDCAFGAMIRKDVRRARLVARQILDHLRDHVAGALDADAVADAQSEPLDLVAVVERDVGDDHPADADGLEPADGRQLAGAADLDVDRFERGLGFLGGKLVREAPARRASDEAEPLLQVQPVHLVDDAVDIERQVCARLFDRAVMGSISSSVVAADEQLADRECRSSRSASSPAIAWRPAAAESRPSRARGSAKDGLR